MASIPQTTLYLSNVDLPMELFLFDSRTITPRVRMLGNAPRSTRQLERGVCAAPKKVVVVG